MQQPAKAKAIRLEEEVENLQSSRVSLQLPASTLFHSDDASSTKKQAAAATQDDASTGTLSTTLRYCAC